MTMTLKDKLDVTRTLVSTVLLLTAMYGLTNNSEGWGWFLFAGVLLYPKAINIDFRGME